MTDEIVYCGAGDDFVLARNDTTGDSRNAAADVPQTASPGTEAVPAGLGEEGGTAEAEQTESGGEVSGEMEQPEPGRTPPGEEADQAETEEEGESVREETPQPASQMPADTGASSPEPGDPSERQEPSQGDEQLPQAGAVFSGEEATGKEEQLLLQGTQTPLPPAEAGGTGLLLPFGAGVLAALGAAALLLWLRHRRPGGAHTGSGLRAASLHEIGDRDSQQDAFCLTGLDAPGGGVLAAVADGMGGLVDSGQVSRALIDALISSFAPGGDEPPARQLQLLFRQALEQVESLRKGQTAQSGSTLVMALIRKGGLSWLSVGDSRICLWRGGGLIQLNRDHDFHHDLTLLALQGDMTLREADQDPRRENLTSFIGRGFPRKVEWNPEPVLLLPGDKVVLMSDGVYRALSQQELARCLRGGASEAARALRGAVMEKRLPQQDNFTAVVLEEM